MRAYLYVLLLLLVIFGSIGGYLFNKFSALSSRDMTPPPVTIAAGIARSIEWPSQLEAVGTIRAARGVDCRLLRCSEPRAKRLLRGRAVYCPALLSADSSTWSLHRRLGIALLSHPRPAMRHCS